MVDKVLTHMKIFLKEVFIAWENETQAMKYNNYIRLCLTLSFGLKSQFNEPSKRREIYDIWIQAQC